MSEITHKDLEALGERLERHIDRMHGETKDDIRGVHARVSENAKVMEGQNTRILKAEEAIGRLTGDARTIRHDFTNHITAHDTFSALVEKLKAPAPNAALQRLTQKPSKGFVAGIIVTITALAGLSEGVQQAITFLLRWFKAP